MVMNSIGDDLRTIGDDFASLLDGVRHVFGTPAMASPPRIIRARDLIIIVLGPHNKLGELGCEKFFNFFRVFTVHALLSP